MSIEANVPMRGRVRWLSPKEGGRISGPPTGPSFAATAVFGKEGDYEREPSEADMFSVVLTFHGRSSVGEWAAVDIRALNPVVLSSIRRRGRHLWILEGERRVAIVEIASPPPGPG